MEEIYQGPDLSYVEAGQPWRSSITPLRHPYKNVIVGVSIHKGGHKNANWHEKNFFLILLETGLFEFGYHLVKRDWEELRFCLGECRKALWCIVWYQPQYFLWWHCKRAFAITKEKLVG